MVNGVICSASMLHRKAFRNIYITLCMSGWCKRWRFSSSQPRTPIQAHLFLDHLTLSHLFHPQSEWVISHSPAQSGLYELITFSFHSSGKCLDVRTNQRRTECCFPPNLSSWMQPTFKHTQECIQKSAHDCVCDKIKYLFVFVTLGAA